MASHKVIKPLSGFRFFSRSEVEDYKLGDSLSLTPPVREPKSKKKVEQNRNKQETERPKRTSQESQFSQRGQKQKRRARLGDKQVLEKAISAMINEYTAGRIKQEHLEKSILDIVEKRAVSRRSSRILKVQKHSATETTAVQSKKEKQKNTIKQQYSERFLNRKGFAKAIILKGINTSLFVNEEADDSHIQYSKNSFYKHIQTTLSDKEVSLNISKQRRLFGLTFTPTNCLGLKELMAIRIQRAWRQYNTRKILKRCMHMMPRSNFKRKNELRIIKSRTQTTNVSPTLLSSQGKAPKVIYEEHTCNEVVCFEPDQDSIQNKIIKLSEHSEIYVKSQDSSSVAIIDYSSEESKNSLSQIDNINSANMGHLERGLKSQQTKLKNKKQKQLTFLMEKSIQGKMTKKQFQKEKDAICKWYKYELKALTRARVALVSSFKQAQHILKKEAYPQHENSDKMLRCLSDKYLPKMRRESSEQEEQKSVGTNGQLQENAELSTRNSLYSNEIFLLAMPPQLYKQTSLEGEDAFNRLDETDSINNSTIINQFDSNSQLQSEKFLRNSLQLNRQFKYMTVEDKEEIFEFMFLDLVLEMFVDQYRESKVMVAIEKHISELGRLKTVLKGIKVNLGNTKQYLRSVYSYVMKHNREALSNINQAMGPTALEMLRYMHEEVTSDTGSDCPITNLVLSGGIFEKIAALPENELRVNPYYQDEEREKCRISFLKSVNHIKNKSLFDCLNEMLDVERPYGIWGKPFPWKHTLSIDWNFNEIQLEAKFRKSIERTVQSCSFLCGILVDKEESVFAGHKISHEHVQQIREDRMSKMLAEELVEYENRWIFYDDEETEILVELSRYFMSELATECVKELLPGVYIS